MEIEENIINSYTEIFIPESLAAPLISIKLKLTDNNHTVLKPNNELLVNNNLYPAGITFSDKLIIYVDKESRRNPTKHLKKYIFKLSKPLIYFNNVSDEFILKPTFIDGNLKMQSYIIRKITNVNDEYKILDNYIEEQLNYLPIELYSGQNYLYSNYNKIEIDAIYPKDNLINNLYLNIALFEKEKDNIIKEVQKDIDIEIDRAYFKDDIIKTKNGLDILANNINTNCLNSKNNKFSIDYEGNLIVNNAKINNKLIAKNIEYETLFVTSLDKKKKNIKPYSKGLELIVNSDIFTFNYKSEKNNIKKHIGLIIGDKYNTPEEIINKDGIDLYSMISLTWNAIKELNEKIERIEGDKNGL